MLMTIMFNIINIKHICKTDILSSAEFRKDYIATVEYEIVSFAGGYTVFTYRIDQNGNLINYVICRLEQHS